MDRLDDPETWRGIEETYRDGGTAEAASGLSSPSRGVDLPVADTSPVQSASSYLLHPNITIEVFQHDWIPGFAAFRDDGSIEAGGKAHVVLNLGAFIAAAAAKDLRTIDIPYVIAESIMHEVIHVLEAWASVEFSEAQVEMMIERYRNSLKPTDGTINIEPKNLP